MTPRTAERAVAQLDQRLVVLAEVGDLADGASGRLPDELAARARDLAGQARSRLGHGSVHTVVAIAGATGSGKSSLFNALVGEDLAEVGARRPTTATAQAATFGAPADRLLDWLQVSRRHNLPEAAQPGLVLLDLPDHDSVAASHRAEVERLVTVVDVFIWVVDPQKYADAALHEGYLRRFAHHGAVTIVALNQIDTLASEADRRSALEDLNRLVVEDGLSGVRTIAVSARTGEGVEPLRRELAARVSERRAVVARLDADIDWVVDDLRVAVGDTEPEAVSGRAASRLAEVFGYAAGVDAVADAVGAAHRHRSVRAAGWPPVRWIRRLRPDPLGRLGLDRGRSSVGPAAGGVVGRSSRAGPGAVAGAAVTEALRGVADDATAGLPQPWRHRVSELIAVRQDDVADALDVAVSSAQLPTGEPRWWRVAGAAQWALTGLMVLGLLWLLLMGVVEWFGLPELPTPRVGGVPWPTWLTLGGAVAGLLLAVLGRVAARIGGQRRARAARRQLHRATGEVAQRLVVAPLDAELAVLSRLRALVRKLGR
ncbi:MAG: GTPase [Acidimicrobiales bacterium]